MGVAGSGKTTTARIVAKHLGWRFVEGDDFHPPENRAKMRAGQGLTEADRRPWLEAVRRAIEGNLERGQSLIVACSALRRAHREVLAAGDPRVKFFWLDVPERELRDRLNERRQHFAGPDLLDSQLRTLAITEGEAITRIDANQPAQIAADQVIRHLQGT
jgi:gluconokinase